MHDIRSIRDKPDAFDAALARRGEQPRARAVLALDSRHRAALTKSQEVQARRNALSREIGLAKAKNDAKDAERLLADVATLKDLQHQAETEASRLGGELEALLSEVPNLPAADVPDGADPSQNREIGRHGSPRSMTFTPKFHFELGEQLGQMDFALAAKLSGARFVVLKGEIARLSRALANFMLDLHTREFGYQEIEPPYLVRASAMFGTGQLPKFADEQFRTTSDYWLIPTAEVPLTNLVRETILEESALPLRFAALTPCFRQEAGAAGKDTRGMIRQHQFSKVELVSIVAPEHSGAEHERMRSCAEEVLRRLALPYRVVLLCAGDLGFSSQKTFDLEVWLPAEQAYREISSCSNCGEFQARRMAARYRAKDGRGTKLVHTLNGSGLAVGRTLIAVLENYQRADGGIDIPEVLRPYMGGQTSIGGQR
jgi:seryl-tRNA synthetase